MIKKLRLTIVIFSFSCFLNCTKKQEHQEILIQKIEITNELCENCIGYRSIQIKYIFNTDRMLKSVISLSTSKSFIFNMKRFEYKSVDKSPLHYEYIHNDFDLTKYGSLMQIKKDYKQIIYFKRIKICNTDFDLIANKSTDISYYLNGVKISEQDSIRMNKNSSSKFDLKHYRKYVR